MITLRRNKSVTRKSAPVFVPIDAMSSSDGGCIALVPGALAPVVSVDVPDRVRGIQREQVAMRQLRDVLGLDLAEVELRPLRDPDAPQAWSRLLLVDKARVGDWRTAARGRCRAVLPDYLALPTAEGIWTVSHEAGQISARLGPFDGFSIELDLARIMLEQALPKAPPQAVLWLGDPLPGFDALWQDRDLIVLSRPEQATEHNLPVPQVLKQGEEDADLLQDPQQDRARLRRKVLPWRWPFLLSAVAIAVWATAVVIETRQLRDRALVLRTATADLARAEILKQGPILDLRAQISRQVQQLRSRAETQRAGQSPLDLMSRSAAILQLAGIRVQEADYTRIDDLIVTFYVPSFAAQDRLEADLRAAGLRVATLESGLDDTGQGVRVELSLALAEEG